MSAWQRHPATENQSFSTICTAEEPRATSSLPRRSLQMTRTALGRGLSALIRDPEPPQQVSPPATPPSVTAGEPQQIDIDLIDPSPYQPRTRFREEPLEELARSIRSSGIIQPLILRTQGSRYQLIAGERRWRATQPAAVLPVPAIVPEGPDEIAPAITPV